MFLADFNPNKIRANLSGDSIFEIFPGQTGRYQEGYVKPSDPELDYFSEHGIIRAYPVDADTRYIWGPSVRPSSKWGYIW